MKKFIHLLLILVPMFALVSCHDDEDSVPNVNFNINIEDGVEIGGEFYVVQGDTLKISGIDVINNESDKAALITAANYYWDGYYMGTSIQPPYGYEFDVTSNVPVGKHQINIECPLFAVDKSPATAIVFIYVNVVESASDIPAMGETTATVHPHISDTGTN